MRIIKTQTELEALVEDFAAAPFVAVDTEFMRERTYWPQLCLIQIARPLDPETEAGAAHDDPRAAAIIDPVDAALDLAPLLDLMQDERVTKVFHAARQDVEIFVRLSGAPPKPLFDSQVAAMVCGFGDQVSYDTLVRKLTKGALDKSSRFTDWSRRPLTPKQLRYALADVTWLRDIYVKLSADIQDSGRGEWVAEEMATLADPATYRVEPEEAWRRLKTRSSDRRFLAVAKALAAWREAEAQRRDTPRNRILKDDALLELCAMQPKSHDDLGRARLLFRESRKGALADQILETVKQALAQPESEWPEAPQGKTPRTGSTALLDLLRVLLKAKSDEIGVASKLLASAADLEAIAWDDAPDTPALVGWRREAFGEDALRLKRGEIALSATDEGVCVVDLDAQ